MEPIVKVTERIRELLKHAVLKSGIDSEDKKQMKCILEDKLSNIPFNLVLKAWNLVKKERSDTLWLNELLEESDLCLPEYHPPERNPELEARCQKLKREQQNMEYKKMTKNVDLKKHYEPESIGKELKQLNNQLLGVGNFIVTVCGAFAFGYKGTEYAFSGSGSDTFPMQLMAGLVLGTIVFFADLYFLVKEDSNT